MADTSLGAGRERRRSTIERTAQSLAEVTDSPERSSPPSAQRRSPRLQEQAVDRHVEAVSATGLLKLMATTTDTGSQKTAAQRKPPTKGAGAWCYVQTEQRDDGKLIATCNFCASTFRVASQTRVVDHLLGRGGIKECSATSDEFIAATKKLKEAEKAKEDVKERKRKLSTATAHGAGTTSTTTVVPGSKTTQTKLIMKRSAPEDATESVARFFSGNNIAARVVETNTFQEMVQAIRVAPLDWQPPKRRVLGGSCLTRLVHKLWREDVEDCVALLGGSPPHEEAELRREGGATTAGTLGTSSGPNAQLSIREAFSLWGAGLHKVIGGIPGIATSGSDFAVSSQLKKIPRELEDAKLLSICRYMTSRLGVVLSAYRTVRGSPLPDVSSIVHKAMNDVFRERDQDQRAEERAAAVAAPLLERIEVLEATGSRRPGTTTQSPFSYKKTSTSDTPKLGARAARVRRSPPKAVPAAPVEPTAREHTQKFLESLNSTKFSPPPPAATTADVPAADGAGTIQTRRQALLELAALYRQHAGMDPKGDPSMEPCAYKALVGACRQDACGRCASGKIYPEHLLKGVKDRCAAAVFAPAVKKGNQKKGVSFK